MSQKKKNKQKKQVKSVKGRSEIKLWSPHIHAHTRNTTSTNIHKPHTHRSVDNTLKEESVQSYNAQFIHRSRKKWKVKKINTGLVWHTSVGYVHICGHGLNIACFLSVHRQAAVILDRRVLERNFVRSHPLWFSSLWLL